VIVENLKALGCHGGGPIHMDEKSLEVASDSTAMWLASNCQYVRLASETNLLAPSPFTGTHPWIWASRSLMRNSIMS
jgi:hypothetical protein